MGAGLPTPALSTLFYGIDKTPAVLLSQLDP